MLIENPELKEDGTSVSGELFAARSVGSFFGESNGYKLFNKRWNQDASGQSFLEPTAENTRELFGDAGYWWSVAERAAIYEMTPLDTSGGTELHYPFSEITYPQKTTLRDLKLYFSTVQVQNGEDQNEDRRVKDLVICGRDTTEDPSGQNETPWTVLHDVSFDSRGTYDQTTMTTTMYPIAEGQTITWSPVNSNFWSEGTLDSVNPSGISCNQFRFLYTDVAGTNEYTNNKIHYALNGVPKLTLEDFENKID